MLGVLESILKAYILRGAEMSFQIDICLEKPTKFFQAILRKPAKFFWRETCPLRNLLATKFSPLVAKDCCQSRGEKEEEGLK